MEGFKETLILIRNVLPFTTLVLAWVIWAMRKEFVTTKYLNSINPVTKEEFRDFKDKYYNLQDNQEKRLTQLTVELKTELKHILIAINELKQRMK